MVSQLHYIISQPSPPLPHLIGSIDTLGLAMQQDQQQEEEGHGIGSMKLFHSLVHITAYESCISWCKRVTKEVTDIGRTICSSSYYQSLIDYTSGTCFSSAVDYLPMSRTSHFVLCCVVLSCLVLSYLVLSCLVLSCLVLSCLVLSCQLF